MICLNNESLYTAINLAAESIKKNSYNQNNC